MPKIKITIKDVTSHFKVNKKPKEIAKLLHEAEKHFGFNFGYKEKHTGQNLYETGSRIESYFIPVNVMIKILEALPEFADIAELEVIPNKDGSQDISKYDCAGAILAMIKAYDNSFEFSTSIDKYKDFNDYLGHDAGEFLHD